MFQMLVPRPKLKPPDSGWTSFVYTRIDSPAFKITDGNWKVGVPSAISVSVHPPISAPEPPVFVISTYSSDSEVGTTPSKNMQEIVRDAGGGGVGIGVGVGSAVGVAVGVAIAVGVTAGGSGAVVGVTVGGSGMGVSIGGIGVAVAVGGTGVPVGTRTVGTTGIGVADAGPDPGVAVSPAV